MSWNSLSQRIYLNLQYNALTWRFFVTSIAIGFVLDGVYGVLLNLYLLRLDYDARFIGEVNSVGLLVFAVVSLPAGMFGTWWTSRRMLWLGLAAMLLGTIALPLGEWSPAAWHELWYICTYALVLIGFSLYFVNGAPFLMAAIEPEKQEKAFAMQNAMLSLAAFVGSLFAGNLPVVLGNLYGFDLEAPEPYRYTLLLTAVIVFAALLISLSLAEPKHKEYEIHTPNLEKPKRGSLSKAIIITIVIMSVVRFLQVAGVGTVSVYFNVYMDTQLDMSPSVIGLIASIGRLLAVPTVLIAPRLIRRSSTASVAVWASLATALALLPIAFIPVWWVAAIAYIGVLSLTNLRFTAFLVYILLLVPKKQQGVITGAGEMAAGFSFAAMALSGGYIVTILSFRELFLLGALLSGMGTLLFGWYISYARRQKNHPPT